MPPEVEAWSLNHWTSREVPEALLFYTPQRKITAYHVDYGTKIFFLPHCEMYFDFSEIKFFKMCALEPVK